MRVSPRRPDPSQPLAPISCSLKHCAVRSRRPPLAGQSSPRRPDRRSPGASDAEPGPRSPSLPGPPLARKQSPSAAACWTLGQPHPSAAARLDARMASSSTPTPMNTAEEQGRNVDKDLPLPPPSMVPTSTTDNPVSRRCPLIPAGVGATAKSKKKSHAATTRAKAAQGEAPPTKGVLPLKSIGQHLER